MKKKLRNFLKFFLPFTLLLFFAQWAVFHFIFYDIPLYYGIWAVYSFHFLATLLIYLLLAYIHINFEDKTGFAFMGCSLFKMFAAILFLLPLLLSDGPKLTDVFSFFIPYFLFLGFETFFAVKLIHAR